MSGAGSSDGLQVRLRRALPAAMKARDRVAVAALRSALAAVDNASAVEAGAAPGVDSGRIARSVAGLGAAEAVRRSLSEDEVAAVVRAEVEDRRLAADGYARSGQADEAARLAAEADVLAAHLGDG